MQKNLKLCKIMQQEVNAYEYACTLLACKFTKKYYPNESWYWIDDEIGGDLSVSDAIWEMRDIAEAIRLNIPVKKLHNWYLSMDVTGYRDYNLRAYNALKKS